MRSNLNQSCVVPLTASLLAGCYSTTTYAIGSGQEAGADDVRYCAEHFLDVADAGPHGAAVGDSAYLRATCNARTGRLGMAHEQFALVLDQGTKNPYFCDALGGLEQLAEVQNEDEAVAAMRVIDHAYGDRFADCPTATLDKANYLLGMLYYRRGKVGEARDFLSGVSGLSTYYTRAQYFLALLWLPDKPERAEVLLERVLKAGPESNQYDQANIQRLARDALARVRSSRAGH